jgi:hypothetical protein
LVVVGGVLVLDEDELLELAAKEIPAPPRARPAANPPAITHRCMELKRRVRFSAGGAGGAGGGGVGANVMWRPPDTLVYP